MKRIITNFYMKEENHMMCYAFFNELPRRLIQWQINIYKLNKISHTNFRQ